MRRRHAELEMPSMGLAVFAVLVIYRYIVTR